MGLKSEEGGCGCLAHQRLLEATGRFEYHDCVTRYSFVSQDTTLCHKILLCVTRYSFLGRLKKVFPPPPPGTQGNRAR
jgi:hypothetical protein